MLYLFIARNWKIYSQFWDVLAYIFNGKEKNLADQDSHKET